MDVRSKRLRDKYKSIEDQKCGPQEGFKGIPPFGRKTSETQSGRLIHIDKKKTKNGNKPVQNGNSLPLPPKPSYGIILLKQKSKSLSHVTRITRS